MNSGVHTHSIMHASFTAATDFQSVILARLLAPCKVETAVAETFSLFIMSLTTIVMQENDK